MIERYIKKVSWTFNGMDYPNLNCWGLARLARHELYNLPLLPELPNLSAFDKRGITNACKAFNESLLEEIETPKIGTIVGVWRGKLLVHVGLIVSIDNRLAVLEIDEGIGVRWQLLSDWLKTKMKVIYYYDK